MEVRNFGGIKEVINLIRIKKQCIILIVLYGYEKDGREIPAPSVPAAIPLSGNAFVNYIACDTLRYRKMYNNKAVKKTLTIPEWLNEAAASMGLNFSQVLQEALLQKVQQK